MKDCLTPYLTTVRVFAYRKAPELPVQLTLVPDFLDLTDFEEREITVEWKLITKGFKFPDDGTAIVFTSPGSRDAFSRAAVTCEGDAPEKTATVKILKPTGLAYAYTISVIDEATKLTIVLDPGASLPSR